MIRIPQKKFRVDLGMLHGDKVDDATKPLAVGGNMPALDGARPTRIVNTDVVKPATCDFGRVEEPGYHSGAYLVGAADKPFIGFMRRFPKQSLMIVGLKDCHPNRRTPAPVGTG